MRPLLLTIVVAGLGILSVAMSRREVATLGLQPDGRYLVSSGQLITLRGHIERVEYARPKDVCASPDGKFVAVLTQRKLMVLDPTGNPLADVALEAAPLGVAWGPRSRRVFASLRNGQIGVYSWDGSALKLTDKWNVVPEGTRGEVGTGGLAVGPFGRLYAALSVRNEVVALDRFGKELWRSKVGVSPYHVAVSPNGSYVAVANRGGDQLTADQLRQRAHAASAGTEVEVDPATDAANSGTVWLFDVGTQKAKSIPVGRQPAGMAFSADSGSLYVTESDSDSMSFIDVQRGRVRGNLSLRPPEEPVFGQMPTDVALSPEGKRLYVTLGGMNAIAVVENTPTPKISGYVSTPWFPIAVDTTPQGITIGAAKGLGSRPVNKPTAYAVHDSVGVVQTLSYDDIRDLSSTTKRVASNNGWQEMGRPRRGVDPVPIPERLGEPSVFRHVLYIIKENLTYDSTLGDMREGNGDPRLTSFGERITPNHHALAREFVLLDNFYISGTNSADGHQWVDSSIANAYTEQNYAANERSYPYDGGDPLAFSPQGFLWTQAVKHGRTVRVYGEFVDKPSVIDPRTGMAPSWQRCWDDYRSGKNEIRVTAGCSQAALRKVLHPSYIGWPLVQSDQWRADLFLKDLRSWEASGDMPNLCMMLLPADHTSGVTPGMPSPRSSVADNDLALGRIVEAVSRSRFWKDTLIVVAEDDSQLGADHVDGHRSIAFCISPYTRRGAVVSQNYNHTSIARTIGLVLGMPPMTRFDRVGRPLTDCFVASADLRPYTAKKNLVPLDEVTKSERLLVGEERELAEESAEMDWDELDVQDQKALNRVIWRSAMPGRPLPPAFR